MQEADVALSAFRPTSGRTRVADQTTSHGFHDAFLLLKPPQELSDSDDFFLRPFRPAVFAAVGGGALLVAMLLLLSQFCEWYKRGRDVGAKPDVTQWLMADAEIVVAGLLGRCKL